MDYVATKTSIPVSRVLHLNLDAQHPLGVYMLLEKARRNVLRWRHTDNHDLIDPWYQTSNDIFKSYRPPTGAYCCSSSPLVYRTLPAPFQRDWKFVLVEERWISCRANRSPIILRGRAQQPEARQRSFPDGSGIFRRLCPAGA